MYNAYHVILWETVELKSHLETYASLEVDRWTCQVYSDKYLSNTRLKNFNRPIALQIIAHFRHYTLYMSWLTPFPLPQFPYPTTTPLHLSLSLKIVKHHLPQTGS